MRTPKYPQPRRDDRSEPADAPKPKSQPQNLVDPGYVTALNGYFSAYKPGESMFGDSLKRSDFVKEANRNLSGISGREIRVDENHPLTVETFGKMLKGEVGPTPELLKAFHLTFEIYGDERDAFLEKGARALQDEDARRHDIWLTTPEGLASQRADKVAALKLRMEETQKAQAAVRAQELADEKRKQEELERRQEGARLRAISREPGLQRRAAEHLAQERIERNRNRWRANNPKGMKDRPSFQEMLEASHANGENFKAFLFESVLPAWADMMEQEMSQVKFCAHLAALNRNRDDIAKPTFTDTILSSWRAGKTKPLRDSVDVMCHAFDIEPEEGELMALHQKMLWKAIDGHEFKWGDKKGVKAIGAAIEESRKSGDTAALVAELIDSSGIRYERLKELLKVEQIPQWKKGAKIASIDMALNFVRLVNPQPTEGLDADVYSGITHVVSRQNRDILSLVTGREFDVDRILAEAGKKGNPGGALFTALIGDRGGMVQMRTNEILVQMESAGIECTDDQLKKMRTGTQLQRGGKIHEAHAEAILGMVEGSMQHLVEIGVCKPFTPEQRGKCMDMLTGQPHPKKMLQAVLKGSMSVGDMIGKTCERRGLNMSTGDDNFCQQVGISHISGFSLNKSHLQRETAEKVAKWFRENYGFTPTEKRQFIALATGLDLKRTPDNILDQVMVGEIGRVQGLREIYDCPNIPRDKLAKKAKVPHHTVQYSVTETSGGRIVADHESIRRIATACGISEDRLEDFVSIYDGHAVARKSDAPDSWAEQVSGRPKGEGYMRSKQRPGSSA